MTFNEFKDAIQGKRFSQVLAGAHAHMTQVELINRGGRVISGLFNGEYIEIIEDQHKSYDVLASGNYSFDGVDCYGYLTPDSVIQMTFENELFDGISESVFTSWEAAIKECSEYAQRAGTLLLQLEAE